MLCAGWRSSPEGPFPTPINIYATVACKTLHRTQQALLPGGGVERRHCYRQWQAGRQLCPCDRPASQLTSRQVHFLLYPRSLGGRNCCSPIQHLGNTLMCMRKHMYVGGNNCTRQHWSINALTTQQKGHNSCGLGPSHTVMRMLPETAQFFRNVMTGLASADLLPLIAPHSKIVAELRHGVQQQEALVASTRSQERNRLAHRWIPPPESPTPHSLQTDLNPNLRPSSNMSNEEFAQGKRVTATAQVLDVHTLCGVLFSRSQKQLHYA